MVNALFLAFVLQKHVANALFNLHSSYQSTPCQFVQEHNTAIRLDALDDGDTGPSRASLVLLEPSSGNFIFETGTPDTEMPPWLWIPKKSLTEESVANKVEIFEHSLIEYGFSLQDTTDILQGINIASSGIPSKIIGCIEFCTLIVQLDESPNTQGCLFATKEVLLASILHFVECLTFRESGHKGAFKALKGDESLYPHNPNIKPTAYSPLPAGIQQEVDIDANLVEYSSEGIPLNKQHYKANPLLSSENARLFSKPVMYLARGASRIKRCEFLAELVLTNRRALTRAEHSDLRDMLLALMEDWRALAIRCVACLYRLEGILRTGANRSQEVIRVAQGSLRVYANLAQRLGMNQLKSQLESKAFSLLYPRQDAAVSALFRQNEASMVAVSTYLTSRIKELLYNDESLMSQLKNIHVTSRVKQPFSFWRKVLKKRLAQREKGDSCPARWTKLEVHDHVALRVIIECRKIRPDENDEDKWSRERLLCYYIQSLIISCWPVRDRRRMKDYIENPKPNGYRSLHFATSIMFGAHEIPFEVQIRSDEMHRVAEHGVAAHWTYKLGTNGVPSLPYSDRGKAAKFLLPSHSVGGKIESSNSPLAWTPATWQSAYIDSIVSARQSLILSTVYVFLAGLSTSLDGGMLMSLPAGAYVSDILEELKGKYEIESDSFAIWRNGVPARLDESLNNGDVVLLCDNESWRTSKANLVPYTK